MIAGVTGLTDAVVAKRRANAREGAIVVAISGIDAAGKGTIAALLAEELRSRGLVTALIGADTWLTPLEQLELQSDPGEEFYRRGIRFDELFADVERLQSESPMIDVILVEGIFLFKRELRRHYDLAIWIDCGFESALARALARNQEKLPPDRLAADYRRIYVPAQKVHLRRDFPVAYADIVHANNETPATPHVQSQNS